MSFFESDIDQCAAIGTPSSVHWGLQGVQLARNQQRERPLTSANTHGVPSELVQGHHWFEAMLVMETAENRHAEHAMAVANPIPHESHGRSLTERSGMPGPRLMCKRPGL